MIDNNDIAILTRLNTLAERYGLKPTDFLATIQTRAGSTGDLETTLRFEVPAHGNKLREERFDKMLHAIGAIQADDAKLSGDAGHILDTLDAALDRAPKPRGRF